MIDSPTLTLIRALSHDCVNSLPLPGDWPAHKREQVLGHLCAQHGLSGYALRQLCIVDPNENWISRERLRDYEKQRRKTVLSQYRVAMAYVDSLTQAGIEVGVFKGADLSRRLYGDIGLRSAKDFDLLVSKDDFIQAISLAAPVASEMDHRLPAATMGGIDRLLQRQKDVNFKLHGDCMIELHARPLLLRHLSERLEWQAHDDGLSRLSFADELFYTLCHGQMASWVRLKWAVDASLMAAQASPEDWRRVHERATAGKSEKSIFRALTWLDYIWGSTFSEPFQTRGTRTIGRHIGGLIRALDRPDARMNHLDTVFFTDVPSDWLRNICNLYFNPNEILLEDISPPIRFGKNMIHLAGSSVTRFANYLSRGA